MNLAVLLKRANAIKLTKDNIIEILYVQSEYKLIYDDGKDSQL